MKKAIEDSRGESKPVKLPRRPPNFVRPYVQSALMCERILDERDSVLSAIRIVDVFYTAEKTKRSSKRKHLHPISALFTLRGGPAVVQASVVLKTPGAEKKPPPMAVELKGGIFAVNLGMQVLIPVDTAGDGSLELFLDGKFAAAVPFQIKDRATRAS